MGGQKSTYQHVDALNNSGYEAYAVHTESGYRLGWFENDTRTICWQDVWKTFDPGLDVLVFPETFGRRLKEYPGKKVVFSKSLYFGFNALGPRFGISDPYRDPDLLGVMVVSQYCQDHFQFAYPNLPVIRVVEHIDRSLFRFVPIEQKKMQIVYVNKSLSMLQAIICTFCARTEGGQNEGARVTWIALDNKTEKEVAGLLGDSLMLVFPSAEEGLGRLPLEALLCGCVVLTWDLGPMSEYVPPLMRTKPGDISGFVSKVEQVVSGAISTGSLVDLIATGARNALAFGADAQRCSVCSAWETLLRRS